MTTPLTSRPRNLDLCWFSTAAKAEHVDFYADIRYTSWPFYKKDPHLLRVLAVRVQVRIQLGLRRPVTFAVPECDVLLVTVLRELDEMEIGVHGEQFIVDIPVNIAATPDKEQLPPHEVVRLSSVVTLKDVRRSQEENSSTPPPSAPSPSSLPPSPLSPHHSEHLHEPLDHSVEPDNATISTVSSPHSPVFPSSPGHSAVSLIDVSI